MRRFVSFTIGALLGGLVGTTLAMLFAPESGLELRARIRERANTLAAEVQKAVNTKRIELQDRLETMRAPKTE
jgi:gas vesicle protein